MNRILLAIALAFATTIVPTYDADAASPKVDKAKAELKDAKAAAKDDKKDLKSLQKIVDKWHDMWQAQKHDKEMKWDEKLADWIAAERQENRADIKEERGEANAAEGTRREGKEEKELETEKRRAQVTREVLKDLAEVNKKFMPTHRGKAPAHKQKSKLLKALVKAATRDLALREKAVEAAETRLDRAKASS